MSSIGRNFYHVLVSVFGGIPRSEWVVETGGVLLSMHSIFNSQVFGII